MIRSTDCHSCTHTSAQSVIHIYFLILKSSQEVRISAKSLECLEPFATFPPHGAAGLLGSGLFPSSHAQATSLCRQRYPVKAESGCCDVVGMRRWNDRCWPFVRDRAERTACAVEREQARGCGQYDIIADYRRFCCCWD